MAANTDEIKIDLDAIDEKVAKPAKGAPKAADTPEIKIEEAAKPAAEVLKPEDGLAKLQKQLDDERAARIESDRRAAESSAAEVAARTESQDNRLHLVTTALEAKKNANAALKSRYMEARAANDLDAEFEIQQEMSKNSAEIIQLESGKKALEAAPKPKPRPSTDPVEQFVSEMSPKSAAWVRSHPEYVRDDKLNRKMIRAHEDAIDDGIKADTPEYFASIERTLGLTTVKIEDPAADDALSAAAAPTRRAAPASAPVTRSGNGAGTRPNVVTLTREEVEMAEMMGQTPEEYAKNKQALKKEGRMN